jgi:hypothetical protein
MTRATITNDEIDTLLTQLSQGVCDAINPVWWKVKPRKGGEDNEWEKRNRTIAGPEGTELHLMIDTYPQVRLSISGNFPKDHEGRPGNVSGRPKELEDIPTSISVAHTKPPDVIAKDIQRRLLPGYEKLLAWVVQKNAKAKQFEEDRIATAKRFATALGGQFVQRHDGRESFDTPNYPGNLYLYNIQANRHSVQFEVRSCPIELAEEIAKTITAYFVKKGQGDR